MSENELSLIRDSKHILVIQADNPDGDSLGSALALEEILGDLGSEVYLYCRVIVPKYLRFISGWDRINTDLPKQTDCIIFVDTATESLFDPTMMRELVAIAKDKPVFIFDHHAEPGELPFRAHNLSDTSVVATGELIFNVAIENKWPINQQAADHLTVSILADSLGFTSAGTTSSTLRAVADLVDLGADVAAIEARRRKLMKKDPEMVAYKGQLLQRIEYHVDNQLALVHIPWEEIEHYSDRYNPSALVIDEMRLVEGVRIAVCFKTYPDGKVTAKLRANPDAYVAEIVAGYFGGGGHRYAAGFKVYEDYEKIKNELIAAVDKVLRDHDAKTS